MRIFILIALTIVAMAVLTAGTITDKAVDPRPTPIMRTVEPVLVKPGELVTVKGENLAKEFVSAVYVMDGKKDLQVTLESQTMDTVTFKAPANLKPGSYKVVVLLNIAEPTLIEEPVRLNITE